MFNEAEITNLQATHSEIIWLEKDKPIALLSTRERGAILGIYLKMPPRPEADFDPAPKRVMVVDDDAVIRMVVSEYMRDAGLHVVEASCRADAITYLRSGGPVDLIFSDIQMAGPFDGLLLAHHVRAIHPAIQVILTSAGPTPAGLHEGEIFIPKPFKLDRILALVMRTLNSTDNGI